jgi:thiaminase
MKHILKNENIFFDNYQATLKKIGGYNDQFEPFIYNEWIKEFSLDNYNSVINRIESFIDSKEYCMDYEFVSKR